MAKQVHPVIEVAHNHSGNGSGETILSTGIRARLMPLAPGLLQEVMSGIQDPPVPKFFNDDKGREEENPTDPDYLKAIQENSIKRNRAALEAAIMFGVELLGGLPEDNDWIKRLRFMEKRGLLNLSGIDFDDPMEKEFCFKRFVAVSNDDFGMLSRLSGVSEEMVAKAAANFRS